MKLKQHLRTAVAAVIVLGTSTASAEGPFAVELSAGVSQFLGFEAGGAHVLECAEPAEDGSAGCRLVAAGGEVEASGTAGLQGPGGGEQDAAEVYRQLFDSTAQVTATRGPRGVELVLAANGTDHEIVVHLPPFSGRDLPGPVPPTRDPMEPDTPYLVQPGSPEAGVPMKHGSCGGKCGTHELATEPGNPKIPVEIHMSCPDGLKVTLLGYKWDDHSSVWSYGQLSTTSLVRNLEIHPFSAAKLGERCRVALGGNWVFPGQHHNATKTVEATIEKPIEVWGQCTTWDEPQTNSFQVTLTLICDDLSF